jgi:hypothetical protein
MSDEMNAANKAKAHPAHRSGWKTSEFWGSKLLMLGTVALHLLPGASTAAKVVSIAVAGLAELGYGVGRAMVKKS